MARIKKRRESKDKILDSENSSSKEDIKPKARNSHVIQEHLITCLLPLCPGSLQPSVGDSSDEHSAPQYEHSADKHSAPKYQHSAPGAEWCSSGPIVMYCTVHEHSAVQVYNALYITIQQSTVQYRYRYRYWTLK